MKRLQIYGQTDGQVIRKAHLTIRSRWAKKAVTESIIFFKCQIQKVSSLFFNMSPWEENCVEAHQRKSLQYADLIADSWEKLGLESLNNFLKSLSMFKWRCFQAQLAWKLFQTLGMVSTVCMLGYSMTTNRDSKEIILLGMTQTRWVVMDARYHVVVLATAAGPPTIEDVMVQGRDIRGKLATI